MPALRFLADAAGVTTAEMSKMIQKGVVPAAEGVDVLVASMSAEFGGLMAEQSKTAAGALSNLEDTVATLGTELGERFLPAVGTAAAGLSEFLGEILTLQGAVAKDCRPAGRGEQGIDYARRIQRSHQVHSDCS